MRPDWRVWSVRLGWKRKWGKRSKLYLEDCVGKMDEFLVRQIVSASWEGIERRVEHCVYKFFLKHFLPSLVNYCSNVSCCFFFTNLKNEQYL